MKVRYKVVEVRMHQGNHVAVKRIPEWELPVLQAVQEEVTELKDVCNEVPPIALGVEYDRLGKAYGAERQEGGFTGIPYVEAVYGKGALGLQQLKRAIEAARLPADTEVTPEEASPVLRQDLIQALSDNPVDVEQMIGEDEEETVE